MERRKRDRSDLKLVCHIGSPELGGQRLTGVSKNISRNGVLLRLRNGEVPPESIEVGRAATVELELPTDHPLEPRCIRCEGEVVRIASRNGGVEIAVQFSNMQFRTLTAALSDYRISMMPKYVM